MKILKNLAKTIMATMEKYNNYVEEDKMVDWEWYIDAAITNSLEEDHTDWTKATHLDYLNKSFQIVKVYPEKNIYHQIMNKISNNTNANISFDDLMCFICKNYLVRFELITKKAQLDKSWDGENVLIALHVCEQITDKVRVDGEKLRMTCPDCDHPDFAIYHASGRLYCFSGSCLHAGGNHDIWDLLSTGSNSFATVVEKVYAAVVDNHSLSMDIIDNLDYSIAHRGSIRNGKDINNPNVKKIMAMCKPEYDYMYQFGFSQNDLEACDCIGLKDEMVSERCNEANEYRHRLCWAIRDIDGKIVGLQGRSILNDTARAEFVNGDDIFKRMYKGDKDKSKKNKEKVLNTFGLAKSNHLYLLYKYVQNANQYTRLVITEGIKDAMRVAQIHCPDVAVVSSFGCGLSDRQVELIKQVFSEDIIIELAYDGDSAGFIGNLTAAKKLKEAGFNNIRFVLYRAKSKTEYYKDFGDFVVTHAPKRAEFVHKMLFGVQLEEYINAAKERGFYDELKPVIKKKAELISEPITPEMSIEDKLKKDIIKLILSKKAAKRATVVM